MGTRIAAGAAFGGFNVTLVDANPELAQSGARAARQALGRLMARAGSSVAAGSIRAADLDERLDSVAIAIEAVPEDLGLKVEVLASLRDRLSIDALLATNTSSLSVTEIGARAGLDGRLLGLHFFSPADRSRLVELIVPVGVPQATVQRAREFVRALGREVVELTDAPGFLVNRLARPLYLEAERLVQEGVYAASVDRIMRGLGFPVGPLEIVDRVGLVVHDAVSRSVYNELVAERLRPVPVVRDLIKRRRTGVAAGAGFHDYRDGKRVDPAEDAAVIEGVVIADAPGPLADAFRAEIATRSDAQLYIAEGRPKRGAFAGAPRLISISCEQDLLDPRLSGSVLGRRPTGLGVIELASVRTDGPVKLVQAIARSRGLDAVALAPRPGLVAHRILASFVNEAAFVLQERYASAAAIDRSIRLALGHPCGPLEWMWRLGGPGKVVEILDALRTGLGAGYDAAPLLRQWAVHGTAVGCPEPMTSPAAARRKPQPTLTQPSPVGVDYAALSTSKGGSQG
jgi:3-hydroxybutyryl-CoA dehydrogenase